MSDDNFNSYNDLVNKAKFKKEDVMKAIYRNLNKLIESSVKGPSSMVRVAMDNCIDNHALISDFLSYSELINDLNSIDNNEISCNRLKDIVKDISDDNDRQFNAAQNEIHKKSNLYKSNAITDLYSSIRFDLVNSGDYIIENNNDKGDK